MKEMTRKNLGDISYYRKTYPEHMKRSVREFAGKRFRTRVYAIPALGCFVISSARVTASWSVPRWQWRRRVWVTHSKSMALAAASLYTHDWEQDLRAPDFRYSQWIYRPKTLPARVLRVLDKFTSDPQYTYNTFASFITRTGDVAGAYLITSLFVKRGLLRECGNGRLGMMYARTFIEDGDF